MLQPRAFGAAGAYVRAIHRTFRRGHLCGAAAPWHSHQQSLSSIVGLSLSDSRSAHSARPAPWPRSAVPRACFCTKIPAPPPPDEGPLVHTTTVSFQHDPVRASQALKVGTDEVPRKVLRKKRAATQQAVVEDHTSSTVWTALVGNSIILTLKAVVWLRTGSSAMLAETVHTLADTLNQALLVLGLRQSKMTADDKYQYGYGRAAYYYSLLSALGLFWCGAGVSIVHGIECLATQAPVVATPETWVVLAISLGIDGVVLARATSVILRRAAKRNALLQEPLSVRSAVPGLWARSKAIVQYIAQTRDPFLAAVFLEDFAACSGVLVAAAGIIATQVTGNPMWDALSSIVIGSMLGGVAWRLVSLNKAYLLGAAVDSATCSNIEQILLKRQAIDGVKDVQTQWLGPNAFAYKAEVDFDGTYLSARLREEYKPMFLESRDLEADLPVLLSFYAEDVTRLVERELKEAETAIQAAWPNAVYIELEPDSSDSFRKMSTYAQDMDAQAAEKAALSRFDHFKE